MATGWRNPKHDLQEESKTVLEQGLALSLALITMVFLTWQTFEVQAYEGPGVTEIIIAEDIPETEQLKKPPPPQRPQIPVATESEDIPEDVTIMDTEIDLNAPPPPPPPPPGAKRGKEESPVFYAYEEAPEPIKIIKPSYPKMAKTAGIEGWVLFKIIIDEKGDVLSAEVLMAEPPGIFDDEAHKAIMKWKFKPAKQRDLPIKVAISQKVEFTLTAAKPPPSS